MHKKMHKKVNIHRDMAQCTKKYLLGRKTFTIIREISLDKREIW